MKPFISNMYWFPLVKVNMNKVKRYFTFEMEPDSYYEDEEPVVLKMYVIEKIKKIKFVGLPKGDPQLVKNCLKSAKTWNYLVDKQIDAPIKTKLKFLGEFRPEQEIAIKHMTKVSRGILVAPPRSGKCLVGNTLIHTSKGLMRFDELGFEDEYNDYQMDILTPFGIKPVSKSYKGVSNTIRITTNLGKIIEGTPEHKVLVYGKDRLIGWKTLEEIKLKDELVVDNEYEPLYGSNVSDIITLDILARLISCQFNLVEFFIKNPSYKGNLKHFTNGEGGLPRYVRQLNESCFKTLFTIVFQNLGLKDIGDTCLIYKEALARQLQSILTVNYGKYAKVSRSLTSKREECFVLQLVEKQEETVFNKQYSTLPSIVYDVTVPDVHCFIANGLINHNTVMSTEVAVRKSKKTLIIAHQTDLIEQFCNETINDPKEVLFNGYKFKKPVAKICKSLEDFENNNLCLATYQTFITKKGKKLLNKIKKLFGLVIIDEVHRAPADCYIRVLGQFWARDMQGLTGTPDRKDNRYCLTEMVVGGVKHICKTEVLIPKVYGRDTADIGVKPKTNYKMWQPAMAWLFKNQARNMSIAKQAIRDVDNGHIVLIPLTLNAHQQELKKMINSLYGKDICFVFNGQIPKNKRQTTRDQMNKDNKIKVIIAQRSMLTGLNIPRLSAIYTVCPISNNPTYEQEVKRICTPMQGKRNPIVRFWLDSNLGMCNGCLKTCAKLLLDKDKFEATESFMRILTPPKEREDYDDSGESVFKNPNSRRISF